MIAPSAETGAIKIASGISKIAAVAAIASGNLDVLKKHCQMQMEELAKKGKVLLMA